MYTGHRIATVLPSHNEEHHIGEVIRSMPDFVDHLIVVDDCSSDNTAAAARECDDHNRVVV